MIHDAAIIDARAELGPEVSVGPYAVIGENVRIGSGTVIGAHVSIEPGVTIGPGCRIYPHAAIGGDPQSLKYKGEETFVRIGRGTILREFVTISRGTVFGGGLTEVGEENFVMAYSHIAHDCKTGRNVVFANSVHLAGHIVVGDYVNFGGLAAVHQFVRIGDHALIGGKAAVVKDIPPYVIAAGDRATLHGLNKIGLGRHGYSQRTLSLLKHAYRIIFRLGLTLNEALERVAAEVEPIPEVVNFTGFINSSQRGITR
jgi:UDP-N-acetylglucosamine acyltransferase